MKKFIVIFLTIMGLFGLLAFSGCSPRNGPRKARTKTRFALDTTVSITYYEAKDEETVSKALDLVSEYEKIFSRTDKKSELYRVNQSGTDGVLLSEDLRQIISDASDINFISEELFDITLGGVSALYDFSGEKRVPDENTLSEALSHTGMEKILLSDDGRLTFSEAGIILDLGAIAKGYIADKVKAFLESAGVKNALINLGGNVLALSDGDKEYAVGIQKPVQGSQEYVQVLKIRNEAVSTSGTYERSFEKDGVFYHHILNPKTGRPFDTVKGYGLDVKSVTVIGQKSEIADMLSTALFLSGPERGKGVI